MSKTKVLSKIKGVQIMRPTDHVIQQFRDLIGDKELKPGDILPSERELADSFGIGRGYIREAIKTLELYGVFKSVPGVGTIVEDLGVRSINDFINNLVQFGVHDYVELVEVRALIEPFNAFRAAVNATDEELETLGRIVRDLDREIADGKVDLQLECDYHIEIARASHNRILANTMTAILPGLIKLLDELDLIRGGRYIESQGEHKELYQALLRRDPVAAERAMRHHMRNTGVHFTVRISEITEEKRASQRIMRGSAAES